MTTPPAPATPPAPQPAPPPTRWIRSTAGILTLTLGGVALLVVLLVGLALIGRAADQRAADALDVRVDSCTVSGTVATIGFTVHNTDSRSHRVTLRIEYRDGAGARLDTDTGHVTVPAGDTVRGSESTILDAPASSGRCQIVGIEAS